MSLSAEQRRGPRARTRFVAGPATRWCTLGQSRGTSRGYTAIKFLSETVANYVAKQTGRRLRIAPPLVPRSLSAVARGVKLCSAEDLPQPRHKGYRAYNVFRVLQHGCFGVALFEDQRRHRLLMWLVR